MNLYHLLFQTKSRANLAIWALFACALWGTAAPVIAFSYQAMAIESTASILLFAGCRFTLAGLLVLIFFRIRNRSEKLIPARQELPAIGWVALFQTFGQYMFYYIGVARSSALMAALLTGTSAFFAFLLAWAVFRIESISLRKWCGCLLTLLAVFIMNWNGSSLTFAWDKEGLLLLSQICSASAAVLLRVYGQKMNPVRLCGWQFLSGGIALCLCALIMGGAISWNIQGFGLLLWLAFVSAAAYTIWGILLKRYSLSLVEIYNTTIPMFGILFTWMLLQDANAFSLKTLSAALLLAAGIGVIETGDKHHETDSNSSLPSDGAGTVTLRMLKTAKHHHHA